MSKSSWAIKARNIGQQDALKALLDPSIELVILSGIAGSGKTLMALAAGLQQVLETKAYDRIIFTRSAIPLGQDMGFLPGDETEKLLPWCGGVSDNLEMLLHTNDMSKLGIEGTKAVIATKVQYKALQFMRGRSFYKSYVIVDEVQNLTPHEIKVLISRAGEDTKLVCLGDDTQIDHSHLSANHNGLGSIIDKAKGFEFIRHINLPVSERSQLCAWSSKYL